MAKILLGSQSPGRKHVLDKFGFLYDTFVPNANEKSINGNIYLQEAIDLVLFNSKLKLDTILAKTPDVTNYSLIITSDTTVFYNNKIYEKTYDKDKARVLLSELVGKTHQVITAVTLYITTGQNSDSPQILSFYDDTKVRITADQTLIDLYLRTDDCLGKAGCYGIQGAGSLIIDQLIGSIDNVIGLPIQAILTHLPLTLLKNLKSNF